jgi:hypothetical protein
VFYLALEDGDRRMQDRCRKLLTPAWRPRDPIPGAFTYMNTVLPGQIVATLAEYFGTYGPARPLVIVDTLGRVLPPAVMGETPYSRDYRVMAQLKDLVDAFPGSALLLCHHDRKALAADFVDSVSGTNGIAGGADTVIVLTRGRGETMGLLQVTGRDVAEGAYAVDFDPAAGTWALAGGGLAAAADSASQRRASAGLDQISRDIAEVVAGHPDGIANADVAAKLGLDAALVNTYLARLAAAGRIKRANRGLYAPC